MQRKVTPIQTLLDDARKFKLDKKVREEISRLKKDIFWQEQQLSVLDQYFSTCTSDEEKASATELLAHIQTDALKSRNRLKEIVKLHTLKKPGYEPKPQPVVFKSPLAPIQSAQRSPLITVPTLATLERDFEKYNSEWEKLSKELRRKW